MTIHHPACSARFGGLCSGCPSTERKETHGTTGISLSCLVCRVEQIARGLDAEAEERAARRGPTCCQPITRDAPGGHVTGTPALSPVTRLRIALHLMAARFRAWPIDPTDLRAER